MTNRKQKFIKYLFALTIILLVTDISIDHFKKKQRLPVVSKISVRQIDSVFKKVLDDYGIQSKWISSKKVKPTQDDSTVAQYFIKIPSDIPVPFILRDINNIIEKDITGFISEEKKIYGTTEIRIYTNEILKLRATLSPDKNIIRTNNELSFIISDALDLSESSFNAFLSVPYPLACTVVPGKSIILKVDSLKNYRKEYAMILNNDISDSEMKLKQEFQKELLRGSIKNIISSFKDARVFLVDEKSTLFNSPIYNFVRDDFKMRGITLYPKSELIELNAKEDSELFSKFKFYCNDTTGVHQKLFISTFENYEKILPVLVRLKKKGHKIIPLSKTFLIQKTN
ncbi:MAG: hypothetical protein NTX65_17755 [Ignavibacteriales bacterium]|nr:hypothetical protein [Ignavibacteriales bacterium]